MRSFVAALWGVNTQGMQNAGLDLRRSALRQAIDTAYEATKKLHVGAGHSLSDMPYGVFLAPEYLMASPTGGPADHSYGLARHMEESDKEQLLQEFVSLSKLYKGMIIVPGTIAWRKPLERAGAKLLHGAGKPGAGSAKTVSRQTKAKQALSAYATRTGLALDRPLSGPKYVNPLLSITAPTTQWKLEAIEQAGPLVNFSGVTHMARNTAYVLYNGDVRLKYNKRGDFHEVLSFPDTVHIPGNLDGRFGVTPTDRGLRQISFGIEVCLDHVYGTAAREIPNLGEVDIHLLTSAQVQERGEALCVRPGGYLVHACSNQSYTGVKRRNVGWLGEKIGPLDVAHETDVSGFPLQCFRLELSLEIENFSTVRSSKTY